MKANEFLTEASIIDKLKGAFKKKQPPAEFKPSGVQASMSPDYETPAYQRKQAYFDKQAAASAKPVTRIPKMKVKKTDPRTALGAKGGSPEFKAAQSTIQQKAVQPAVAQPSATTATRKRPAQDPATGKFTSSKTSAPAAPAKSTTTSVPGIDQNMLAKAVLGSIKQITDPDLLKGIRAYLDSKASK